MKRIIALVDCDSFFVSCEQSQKPELKGKAVCVLSNNDGCVVSRSKEAKKMGVKMGAPLFMAGKEFPQCVFLSGNHKLYRIISKRVIECLRQFSPDVEVYSIDEAFVDLTGTRKLHKKNYIDIAKDIRKKVLEDTDIPVSIGISTSKTLAKLASDKAKNVPDGVFSIGNMKLKKVLKNTDITEVWGIGRNISVALKKKGILKCSDLVKIPDSTLKSLFGIKGQELKHELLGETLELVSGANKIPKSIQDTSAFGFFTSDIEYLKQALNKHIHVACKKLRKYNGYTGKISVMLRTKDFRVCWDSQILTTPLNFELEISKKAIELLKNLYEENVLYRATGIGLNDLTCSKNVQRTLFEEINQNDNSKLATAIDNLEEKFGKNIVRTGF